MQVQWSGPVGRAWWTPTLQVEGCCLGALWMPVSMCGQGGGSPVDAWVHGWSGGALVPGQGLLPQVGQALTRALGQLLVTMACTNLSNPREPWFPRALSSEWGTDLQGPQQSLLSPE